MNILGISAFYHDSAASLVSSGQIVAAAQEERFTRKKHDSSFPSNSIKYCLKIGNLSAQDIDFVVFYEKPLLKFDRLFETYLAFAPRGFSSFKNFFPLWAKDKLFQKSFISKELSRTISGKRDWSDSIVFSEHHLSHAASAFFPSPFESAAVLTMDGVGEWATTSVGIGNKNRLSIKKEIHFPHSLGLLYSAFTYYTGFKVNSGEYKVMGLAPYGNPKYVDIIKNNLIELKSDGSFALDVSFFDYCVGATMTNHKFDELFGAPARKPDTEITQRDMDLAASIQAVTDEAVVNLATTIQLETKEKNLCLAGGVALNCVSNGRLLKIGMFEKIWIQPAAGDAGGSLGAALAFYYSKSNAPRIVNSKMDSMAGSLLGPSYSDQEILNQLRECKAIFYRFAINEIIDIAARALADGKALGWHSGRMEFGPRSLGARSILADPRSKTMQKNLNLKIKYRESFRPFAPSVLEEESSKWFDLQVSSPYMLLVADVMAAKLVSNQESNQKGLKQLELPRSLIPAVTHIDNSARVQTVDRFSNPTYHALITRFYDLTGCPVLVNTSFNVRGEPMVESPSDAFRCFMGTELDLLVVGNYIMYKHEQDPELKLDYRDAHEKD